MQIPSVHPRIALIGAGRVGTALGLALHHAGYPITAVASRTIEHAAELAKLVSAPQLPLLAAVQHADLVLLVVPDDAIHPLAQVVADAGAWQPRQLVVHASGALPAQALAPAAACGALIGSFHPLAAFAQRNTLLPPGLTFGIEAAEPLRGYLHQIAQELGGYPLDLDAAAKPLYHAAAVLASNYTVVLAALAVQLMTTTGASEERALAALLPLLDTTLANLHDAGLPAALTGPLVRGDSGTVTRHLAALDDQYPLIANVYRATGEAALALLTARHTAPMLSELASALASYPVPDEAA
ncbi:MAG: DUF2520 domain-containing protein [Herpetosiphonaceae bacterium]|nr:DUF2520 domain-containing protein [Herpetosiphonaceae bacterium]